MSTPESEAVNPMDAIETLVRTRFEAAVGSLDLDVPSLVSAGTTTGQRMRRNRRIVRGSMAVAGVAVLATLAGLGLSGGLLDHSSPPVKRVEVQKLVPSDPRAFAAAVIADLPPGITVTSVGQNSPFPGTSIRDSLLGTWSGSNRIVNLSIGSQPLPKRNYPVNCNGRDQEACSVVALPGGGRARMEVFSDSGSVQVEVFAIRSDDVMDVSATAATSLPGQARALARSIVKILRDPAVGMSTYPTYLHQPVPGFRDVSG